MPSVSATTVSGDPSAVDMEDDIDDLPVILTPVTGSEELPDFIEPRPGLKILVRPLEMEEGATSGGGGGGGGDAPAGAAGAAGSSGTAGRAVGSSDNPIQLVQQGNTFKSLQPLSREQLKQIATVLQQSRLNVPSNSKNSLYDADTNTRIVYRWVAGSVGKVVSRPKFAEQISVEVGEQNVIFTGIIFFQNMESKTE